MSFQNLSIRSKVIVAFGLVLLLTALSAPSPSIA